ncbi:MAG TPA: amidohydrolase family protein [Thermoplasmata archaeon]|nr:amidohydrolase family protein [Thermoplasmata archaeon]
MPGVTDVHVHMQPFEMMKPEVLAAMKRERPHFEFLARITHDPEAFLAVLDDVGVNRACLINYVAPEVMGYTDKVNAYVVDYARRHRDRLIPFGSVHPRFTPDPEKAVRKLIRDDHIGGIKIHPPHQLFEPNAYVDGSMPALRTLYEEAEDAKVPVMIHTGTSIFPGARAKFGNPLAADDVATDFGNLRIILAHGGRPFWCEEAFFLVRRHRNVYLDISSIPPKRLLYYFPRLEDIADKALFGSDWPGPGVPGIAANLRAFRGLRLTASAKARILSENATKVFPA